MSTTAPHLHSTTIIDTEPFQPFQKQIEGLPNAKHADKAQHSPVALAQQVLATINLAINTRVHSKAMSETECKLPLIPATRSIT